jgi:hypothetical protein
MDSPTIPIGQKVMHPDIPYDLRVVEYHYVSSSDYIRLGEPSNMVYSGKVRCEYIDENGSPRSHLLLFEDELILR